MSDMLHAQLKIMLAEDHRDTREAIMHWLHGRGFAARAAEDIQSCLELARQEPFDLLLCDLILPDGNGWDLLRELRAHHSLIAIAASGRGSPEDCARSRKAGFVEHLVKPFTFQQLAAALERAAALAAAREPAAPGASCPSGDSPSPASL